MAPKDKRKNNDAQEIFALHDRSQPKPPKPKKSRGIRKRGRGSRPRGNKNPPAEDEDDATGDGDEDARTSDVEETAAPNTVNAGEDPTTNAAITEVDADEPLSQLQIMGLHDPDPIISYKGNVYSCQWATGIGSDLVFAKRSEDSNDERPVLQRFGSWNLLGMTSGTLVASSASLLPKSHGMMAARANDTAEAASAGAGVAFTGGLDEHVKQQPLFLKRLTEIKAWKGEANNYTLTTLQGKTDPAGRVIDPPRARGGNTRGGKRARKAGRARASGTASPRQSSLPRNVSTPTPTSWSDLGIQLATSGPQSTAPSSELRDPTNPSQPDIS